MKLGSTPHKTEQSATALIMHWMRDIIKEMNLDLGLPDVETSSRDRKRPDIVFYKSQRSTEVICLIEAKLPYYDLFDEKLKKDALEKANHRRSKYFALTDFRNLIWFNTEKVNALKPEEEQVISKFYLSNLENIDDIEFTKYSTQIKNGLREFIEELYVVSKGKKPEPKLPIDEFLIFRLHEKIGKLAKYYKSIVEHECLVNKKFCKELIKWFHEQGWTFSWQSEDFDKISRQTAYLLVNKILFYHLLQAKRPQDLDPLEIPENLTKGSVLKRTLQAYFDEVLKIDYETIYTTDFIDHIAFPEKKDVVNEIKALVTILKRYDFSKIGYDVIGRIFERLIPQKERHNLGQYFTNADVVDLILKFCINHENDKILDPSCGAGTFLVRAYQHKKLMNQRKTHEEILEDLWGVEISKFPAHLATINLSINDLSVEKNYPNIIHEDFFNLKVGDKGWDPEKWRKLRAKTLGLDEKEIIYPRLFEAIVGNPPYTRQEEIPEIGVDKNTIIEKALSNQAGKKFIEISKRAGIHAYFFVHGTKFLKDKGYFGFIVSNSWLDVEYGKGLQELFLKYYKIIAIIESKVERWFEDADVNTCIVILQKNKDEIERNNNLVRFVYLKKPLRHFIPPAQDIWEKQLKRLIAIDKLKKTILAHNEFYENDELRIFPKLQKELWEEGFDNEEKNYIGSKWGKYLRAPEIYFKILEKGKDKLVQLRDIAEIKRGFTTGANEFFYLTEEEIKKKGIEKEFWMHKDKEGKWTPNYLIKSPKECKSIVVSHKDLKYRVLMVHEDKKKLKETNVLKYIEWGEKQGFHKRPTCSTRERWYDLGVWEKPDLIWSDAYNDKYAIYNPQQSWADKRFFYIYLKNKTDYLLLCSYLNSSIIPLLIEIEGITNLGEGAIYTNVYQLKRLQVPSSIPENLQKHLSTVLNHLSNRKILSIFHEIGASSPGEVTLEKVKPDRRELDKLIMGEILGLTDEEQLEVYRAVIDLVKSRIEKAKSVNQKKTKKGINIDAFVKTIFKKISEDNLGNFYRDKILSQEQVSIVNLPKVTDEIRISQDIYCWRLYFSKNDFIQCSTEEEARYLEIFLDTGINEVRIPKDKEYLKQILPQLEKLKSEIDEEINFHLDYVIDKKLKEQLKHRLWSEILKD